MKAEELKQVDMEGVATATSISVCVCRDPSCGPHIIFYSGNTPAMHAPMSIEMTKELIHDLQECIDYKTGPRQ